MRTLQNLLLLIGLGSTGSLQAADVTVDCDPSSSADYHTITAALEDLSLEGPNTIAVLPGLCVENVVIEDRERLSIFAPVGRLTIEPAVPEDPVIMVRDSRDIVLRTLSADRGNSFGYVVSSSSGVRLEGNHANSNGGGGYLVEDDSSVVFGSHATENGGTGLLVTRSSFAVVESASLRGNAGDGLTCRDGSTCIVDGNVELVDNGSIGLAVVNGSMRFIAATGPNTVRGNFSGMVITSNSRAVVSGSRGNSVTGNLDTGIGVAVNSSVLLSNTTVADNAGPGVSLATNSVGEFPGDHSGLIRDNGRRNVVCDSSSLLVGELRGVPKVACDRNDRDD